MQHTECCEKCICKHNENDYDGPTHCTRELDCPCHKVQHTEERGWLDSYKGKAWGTAVEKAFEAPFQAVAVQHLINRLHEKYEKDKAEALLYQKKELREALEAKIFEDEHGCCGWRKIALADDILSILT